MRTHSCGYVACLCEQLIITEMARSFEKCACVRIFVCIHKAVWGTLISSGYIKNLASAFAVREAKHVHFSGMTAA